MYALIDRALTSAGRRDTRRRWRIPRAWWSLRRCDRDRGGIAAIVAIVMGGGVLLGMTALTVDVGQIYVEREELQSGADAAAAAIAKDCAATSIDECRARALATADRYADRNAKDGASNVLLACVNSGSEPPCSTPRGNLTDCIEKIPAGSPYVEVQTLTRDSGHDYLLPTFARALAGNSDFDGTPVAACARSTWTTRSDEPPIGITVSDCEYQKSIDSYGQTMAIGLRHQPTCDGEPSGFGFVKDPSDCVSSGADGTMLVDAQYGQPAAEYQRTATACKNRLDKAIDSQKPVNVPLYSTWDFRNSPTAQKWFNLTGNEAGFVVTGYSGLPGIPTDRKPGDCTCTNREGCVYGYFLPGYGPPSN